MSLINYNIVICKRLCYNPILCVFHRLIIISNTIHGVCYWSPYESAQMSDVPYWHHGKSHIHYLLIGFVRLAR